MSSYNLARHFVPSPGLYKSTDAGATWNYITPAVNILEAYDGSGTGGQGNYDLGFTVNNQDPDIIYSGGVNLWSSDDGGYTFNPVSHWTTAYGPTIHGDIHMIATQPQTGYVFVCSDGGIYRTGNIIAQTWTDANNGIPWPTQWSNLSNGMAVTSFYRLSSSKNTLGKLIAGAQDNATFYYDGTIWSTIIGGDGMDNFLDPIDNNLIIGSSQYGNFSFSQDGGFTYNGLNNNPNLEAGEWTTPFVADLLQPGTMYSGFSNVSTSTDGGNNWTMISNFPVNGIYNNEISALAVSYSNSNYIYATKRVRYEYSSPGSVYMTNNSGASWNDITLGLPDSLYYTSIDISQTQPLTAYVSLAGFSAGNKIYKTTNGGSTWNNISFNLPNIPVNCIKTIPSSNKIVAATDIGIYILDSASNIWTLFSQGLPNVIVSDIEFNPALNKTYVSTFGRGIWEIDLDVLTGTEKPQISNFKAELYPSINNGNFIIKISGRRNQQETIPLNIIDIKGSHVSTKILQGNETNVIKLDLPSGVYFARFIDGKNSLTKKFIIE
ncbi:hypothetical protein BH11BAC2_BH11BAC2_10270 [soil metagenome]